MQGLHTLSPRLLSLIFPTLSRQLLGLGRPPTRPTGRWRLRRPMGIDPGQYLMLIPAEPPAVRHLEWPGDQMRILSIGGAGANRRRRLADQRGQLLNEKDLRQATGVGHGVHGLHACLTSDNALARADAVGNGASSSFVSLMKCRRTSRCFLHLGLMTDGGSACASTHLHPGGYTPSVELLS